MASDGLPDGWQLARLSELGEVNRGRSRYRPRYAEHLYGGPYPFIQTGDIKTAGGRITSYQHTYSEAGLRQSRLWPAGTMCITIAANIAETGILEFPACFPDSVVGFVADEGKCDVRFVEYTFRYLRDRIQHEATGSVQDNINLEVLGRLRLPMPPMSEQRAIAHILGTLDDKIELNRRMNETLEAMARALFKSWFVNFEPVRAKMDGRWKRGQSLPGIPAHLYDLFPNRLVDSELGEIPEGWKAIPLRELLEINPARRLPNGTLAPYLDMANMPTHSGRATCVVQREAGSGVRFVNGDTLVARITPCLENGKTCFVDFLKDGEVGWGSTEYIVLHPRPPIPDNYAYFLARMDDFRTFAISNMTGTSGRQRVPVDSLGHFTTVEPPAELSQCFGRLAETYMRTMKANDEESRTLAALRDALLPKLISGEIRPKKAKNILGEII